MTHLRLKHVHRYMKGGRLYHYFRCGTVNERLHGAPGSREFMDAYHRLLEGEPGPIGAARVVPRSMSALAVVWYQSPGFTGMTPTSQQTYRRLLEAFLNSHGDKPVEQLEPRHLLRILRALSATPAQSNALRNVLRLLLQFGFEEGWRKDNPMRDVKRLRYVKTPYRTWTEEDIEVFEARWPRGTRARLALALLLYTGQRRSDVIRMGPQHVRNGVLSVRQRKTNVELQLPVHPELRAELDEAPKGHLAFLMTELGRPFASGTGFYNWFVDCAAKAGIAKNLSPHGLRKATARRLAEAGCTPHQIAAITGHQSLQEVERYTKKADQKRLAAAAVVSLGRPKRE